MEIQKARTLFALMAVVERQKAILLLVVRFVAPADVGSRRGQNYMPLPITGWLIFARWRTNAWTRPTKMNIIW
jgi:hypothetical protein